MEYPALEIYVNNQSTITFSNLDFSKCSPEEFCKFFNSQSRDGKIVILYKNNFIKREHIPIIRAGNVYVILHFSEILGQILNL